MSGRRWMAYAAMAALQMGAGAANAGSAPSVSPSAASTANSPEQTRRRQCGDLFASLSYDSMMAAVASSAPTTASDGSDAQSVKVAIAGTICGVRELRDAYTAKIQVKRNWQSVFDSSLIGLGIASVASAFYGAPTGAIGGVALTAAGLQQYRSYYNPGGEGLAYIKAVKAARCINSNAEPLLNESPETLWKAIAALNIAINKAQSASTSLDATAPPTGASDMDQAAGVAETGAAAEPSKGRGRKTKAGKSGSTKSNAQSAADQKQADDKKAADLKAAQTTATQQKSDGATAASDALAAAYMAMVAALAEARAYNDSPAMIDQAHDAIKNYIDVQLHRVDVSYSDVEAALNKAIDSATNVQSNVQQAKSQLITATRSSAKAGASSGTAWTGVAPYVTSVGCLTEARSATRKTSSGVVFAANCASAGAAQPSVDTESREDAAGAASAPAATMTQAAQANASAVADLIAATTNVVNLTSAHRFTTIDNQITVTCVAGLAS